MSNKVLQLVENSDQLTKHEKEHFKSALLMLGDVAQDELASFIVEYPRALYGLYRNFAAKQKLIKEKEGFKELIQEETAFLNNLANHG